MRGLVSDSILYVTSVRSNGLNADVINSVQAGAQHMFSIHRSDPLQDLYSALLDVFPVVRYSVVGGGVRRRAGDDSGSKADYDSHDHDNNNNNNSHDIS